MADIKIGTIARRPVTGALRTPGVGRGAFGVAKHIQRAQFGDALTAAATDLQKKIDTTRVRDALNSYDNQMIAFSGEEYAKNEADSLGAVERISSQSDKVSQKAITDFKLSGTAQEMFGNNVQNSRRGYVTNVGAHERSEIEKYQTSTVKARNMTVTNRSIQNRNNDLDIINDYKTHIAPNLVQLAKQEHGDKATKDVIDAYVQAGTDAYFGSIIDASADADSATSAYAKLQKYGGAMSPALVAKYEAELKGASETEIIKARSIAINKGFTTLKEKLDAADTAMDVEGNPLPAEVTNAIRRDLRKRHQDGEVIAEATYKKFYESEADKANDPAYSESDIPRGKLDIAEERKLENVIRERRLRNAKATLGKGNTPEAIMEYARYKNMSVDEQQAYDPNDHVMVLGTLAKTIINDQATKRESGVASSEDQAFQAAKQYAAATGLFRKDNGDSDAIKLKKATMEQRYWEQFRISYNNLPDSKKEGDAGGDIAAMLMGAPHVGRNFVDYRFEVPYHESADAIFEANRPANLPKTAIYDKEANVYYTQSGNTTIVYDTNGFFIRGRRKKVSASGAISFDNISLKDIEVPTKETESAEKTESNQERATRQIKAGNKFLRGAVTFPAIGLLDRKVSIK